MAKSIRSKAKRKLRAVKREKIVAKERLRLLAIKEQEEGIKVVEDEGESALALGSGNTFTLVSGKIDESTTNDEAMEIVTDQLKKTNGKNAKSSKGKNIKRLKKKKKNKYKW